MISDMQNLSAFEPFGFSVRMLENFVTIFCMFFHFSFTTHKKQIELTTANAYAMYSKAA